MPFAIVWGGCEATKPGLKATPSVTVPRARCSSSRPWDNRSDDEAMDQVIADGWNPASLVPSQHKMRGKQS